MYLYLGHLGGVFTSDEYLDYDELYCEQCGDSDTYEGEFTTVRELIKILCDNNFAYYYIQETVADIFGVNLVIPDKTQGENQFVIKKDEQGKEYPFCKISGGCCNEFSYIEDDVVHYDMELLTEDGCEYCSYKVYSDFVKVNTAEILDKTLD